MSVQPDLFGEFDVALAAADDLETRRVAWRHRLKAEPAPLPWNCGKGRKGEVVDDWWHCLACGEVELGGYVLGLNHGFHPDQPDLLPWAWTNHGGCTKQMRAARRPA